MALAVKSPIGYGETYAESYSNGTYGDSENASIQASTPFLEAFRERVKANYSGNAAPHVFEGAAGFGDHSIRLVIEEGFKVTANDNSEDAVRIINSRISGSCPPCLQTRIQVIPGDIVGSLRTLESQSVDGFYTNSFVHTLTRDVRRALYGEGYKVQPVGGVTAHSFKAEGDALENDGELVEETLLGRVVRDRKGIERLFVSDPDSLIVELEQAGYGDIEVIRWDVPKYIAKKDYPEGTRKFIGFIGTKK